MKNEVTTINFSDFETCSECGKLFPKEMIDENVCAQCYWSSTTDGSTGEWQLEELRKLREENEQKRVVALANAFEVIYQQTITI